MERYDTQTDFITVPFLKRGDIIDQYEFIGECFVQYCEDRVSKSNGNVKTFSMETEFGWVLTM